VVFVCCCFQFVLVAALLIVSQTFLSKLIGKVTAQEVKLMEMEREEGARILSQLPPPDRGTQILTAEGDDLVAFHMLESSSATDISGPGGSSTEIADVPFRGVYLTCSQDEAESKKDAMAALSKSSSSQLKQQQKEGTKAVMGIKNSGSQESGQTSSSSVRRMKRRHRLSVMSTYFVRSTLEVADVKAEWSRHIYFECLNRIHQSEMKRALGITTDDATPKKDAKKKKKRRGSFREREAKSPDEAKGDVRNESSPPLSIEIDGDASDLDAEPDADIEPVQSHVSRRLASHLSR
jgi:hypothetical protein